MNNPISRMPNPMAPMGQVPPIPPMGANPTAQNPSAMPLPVVNQPTVDMQMMGTTANQRKKFNDLLESLSAPRQPVEKPVQNMFYGGMAGYGMPMMPMMNPYMGYGMGYGGMGIGGMGMNPYSMAYPSYTPGFGTTSTTPTTPTPTDTSQSPFGNTISPNVAPPYASTLPPLEPLDPLKDYDPTKYQQQYGHIQPDFFTSPEWKDAYSYRGPGTMDAGWGKYFGSYGSGTTNNLYNTAYQDWANRTGNEMIEMERPDYMDKWPNPSLPPVEDAPLDPPVTTMPIEPRPKLPWEQYAGKLAPIVDGEIKAWNSDWGEQPRDPRDVFDYDKPIIDDNFNWIEHEQNLSKNMPPLDLSSIMTTMANGGEVQYLRGGGSTLGEMRRRYDVKAAKNEGALNEIRDRVARMLNPNVAEGSTPDMADMSSEGGIMAAIMEMLKKAPLFNQGEWDKFNTSLEDSGLRKIMSNIKKGVSDMNKFPKFVGKANGGQVGIGSFANGGPVQYLRGGGPTKPRIKRFDRSTNEDTTIPDTASKIGNFLSNLFSGGKDNKPSFSPAGPTNLLPQAIDRPSPMERQRERNLDRISNVGGSIGDAISNLTNMATGSNMQKFADDFVGTQEGVNKAQSQILPNVISSLARAGSGGNFASAQPEGGLKGSLFDYSPDPFQVSNYLSGSPNFSDASSIDSIATIDTSGGDNLGLGTINTMETIEDALNRGTDQYVGAVREEPFMPITSAQMPQAPSEILAGSGRGADPRNFMQGNAGRGDDPRKFMYQGDAGRGSDPRDFMTEPLISSVQDQEPLGSGMYSQSGQTPPEIGGIGLGSGIASVDPVSTGVRANVQSGSGADFDQPITLPGEEGARPENMTQIGGYNRRTGWMDQISRGNTIDPVSGYPYSIMISADRVGMTPEEYSNLSFSEKRALFPREMEVQRADMAYGLRKHATALKNFDFTAPVDNYGAMSQGREGSTYRGPINTGGGNFFQEMIDKIIPPSEDAEEVPTPTPTATGGYTCPDGWLYDANTSSCVKQGKGFGGQGMNMGGAVSPSLNNAVDNFLQALA